MYRLPTQVSTIPSLEKLSKPCILLSQNTCSHSSENPTNNSKTKYLVPDQRLRWSSHPSCYSGFLGWMCVGAEDLLSHGTVYEGEERDCTPQASECFFRVSRRSWVKILTWPYSRVESNRKDIKWVTILKRDSAKWEIRVVVKVSLVGFPYSLHSCRKPSRVCAVVDFFFAFTEFYKIC